MFGSAFAIKLSAWVDDRIAKTFPGVKYASPRWPAVVARIGWSVPAGDHPQLAKAEKVRRSLLVSQVSGQETSVGNGPERAIAQDDVIVTKARAGSPSAFAELHAIYSRRLYKTIIAITKSPEDAQDVLQETFLRGYLAIHNFEGRSTVYSWLTRIAVNNALMMLRRRRARPEILFESPDALCETFCFATKDSAADPEQVYYLRQRHVRLRRAIRKLNPCLRGPIRMQMAKECSLKDIARALNISESAVKSRLRRARLKLSAVCQEP